MTIHSDATNAGRNGTRLLSSHTLHIPAPVSDVFPLFCPVREVDWLDGWAYTMHYAESGLAEEHGVFSTEGAIWVCTAYQPVQGHVAYLRVEPGLAVTHLEISCQPATDSGTTVAIHYRFTSLSPAGDAHIIARQQASAAVTSWFERAITHFLATGTKLLKSS